jgi:predicted RNase H-like HicB family nuclease
VTESTNYIKIVEWSDEDQCFVGQCPGIIGPCCHGDNELEVYAALCDIVDEWLLLLKERGEPLPPPTSGQEVSSSSWLRLPSGSLPPVSVAAGEAPQPPLGRVNTGRCVGALPEAMTPGHRRDRSRGAKMFVAATSSVTR